MITLNAVQWLQINGRLAEYQFPGEVVGVTFARFPGTEGRPVLAVTGSVRAAMMALTIVAENVLESEAIEAAGGPTFSAPFACELVDKVYDLSEGMGRDRTWGPAAYYFPAVTVEEDD